MARSAGFMAAIPAAAGIALLTIQAPPGAGPAIQAPLRSSSPATVTPGPASPRPTASRKAGHVPPSPRYSPALEWPLAAFHAYQIWAHTEGAHVTIAVIDTGIASQPGLRGVVTKVLDLQQGHPGDLSSDSHGTVVAGLIAARGSRTSPQRMVGLAPQATLIDVRVATEAATVTPAEIAAGINAAVRAHASVINISLGTATTDHRLAVAVRRAEISGLLVVASAGTTSAVPFPARYRGVLRVAGITQAGQPVYPLTTGGLAVYAPGAGLSSTAEVSGPHRVSGYLHGLSGYGYATAYASAAAALLLSADSGLTPDRAGELLADSASHVFGGTNPGLLEPLAALKHVLRPGPHHHHHRGAGSQGGGNGATGGGGPMAFGWKDVLLVPVLMLAAGLTVIWRRRTGRHDPAIWDEPAGLS
jgi:membrane-anchored mycosin MYCP